MVSSVDSITDYYLSTVVGTRIQNDIAQQLAELANGSSLLIGSILYTKDADGNITAASLPSTTLNDTLYQKPLEPRQKTTSTSTTSITASEVIASSKQPEESLDASVLEIPINFSPITTGKAASSATPSNQLDLFIQNQTEISSPKTTPQAPTLASFSFIENRSLAAQTNGFELELSPETIQAIQHLTEAQLLATTSIQSYLSSRNPFAANWVISNRPTRFYPTENNTSLNIDVSTNTDSGSSGDTSLGLGLQAELSANTQSDDDASEGRSNTRQSKQRARQLTP